MVLATCLAASSFSVEIESGLWDTVLETVAFTVAGNCLFLFKWGTRPAFILVSIAQVGIIYLLASPLTYIAASIDLPIQDAALGRWDRSLGLDWIAYYNFVTSRPALVQYACLFYAMIGWPAIGVPVLLGLTKNYVRLQQFTTACIVTISITVVLSALIPAFGTYYLYHLPTNFSGFNASGYLVQLDRLPLVRDGSLRILNISKLGGIITFPSFHAAAAALAMWGLWGVWWMRPLALIVNLGMLLATPLMGGHYFVDVLAGVSLATIAIAIAKSVGTRSRATLAAIETPAVA
jgi:membrane-associated phospholipid phosphatase